MSKEPKPKRRFNNGHKTFNYQEQEFLKEIYNGERNSCDKFHEKAPTMRRPRDPIMGEATPRTGPNDPPSTELWLPATHFPPPFSATFTGRDRTMMTTDETSVDVASTLNKRKQKIDSELQLIQKQLAYKRSVLGREKL
mmetsp:Transcript_22610/g.33064  ORF Transcript_22610/g.33064 Transcript_22610/m.33064 type:complete len:139 (-) Transcript_22610:68-484(-)